MKYKNVMFLQNKKIYMIVKIMNENGNKSKKQFDNYFFMAIMRKKILTLEKIMKKKIQRETYTTKKRTER
jgi:hypothetical protein